MDPKIEIINRRTYLEHYWDPYLLCEREFLEIADYVSIRKTNYSTCSEKLIRSLLTTCELFETTAKATYNLDKAKYPQIIKCLADDPLVRLDTKIHVKRGIDSLVLMPLANATEGQSPKWWEAHNSVKHNRMKNYEKGNLENAIESLAALYYLNLVFAKRIGDYWHEHLPKNHNDTCDVPNDISHLFVIQTQWETRNHVVAYEAYLM